jgi:drug/metabolite transporter (DMT)-like permease
MKIFFFLVLATALETGGDAIIRNALPSQSLPFRLGLFLLGALVLAAYGTTFNLAPIDFGTAAAVYSSMVFVTFQITNYVVYRKAPTHSTWIAGLLIVAGGFIAYRGR